MSSCEPSRTAAYSCDLRWRIVWHCLANGQKYTTIAKYLGISIGTVHNVMKVFKATGEVKPRKAPLRPSLHALADYEEIYIIGLVLHNPKMELKELHLAIQEEMGAEVSIPTICRLLRRYGMPRKKIQTTALQRNTALRSHFMSEVLLFPKEMFVWVDETGCDRRNYMRKYGYALRGERAIQQRYITRGNRVNAIVAICTEGVIEYEFHSTTVNADHFIDFLRGSLIPMMLPFDGCNHRSIIVLDNASIHHTADIHTTLQEAGILALFLPPYSPDLNPIELMFGHIKEYLKEHEDLIDAAPSHTTLLEAAIQSITPRQCLGWISHCSYD